MRAWWSGALLAVLAVLAGCAAEPRVMQLEVPGGAPVFFPSPQTGEVPRYRYLGELLGESNFKLAGEGRSGARKLLAWVAGLAEQPEQPVVLQRPQTGTVDDAGRVLVTDVSRNAVYVFDAAGGRLDVWEQAATGIPFRQPVGIAIGAGGEVLVADAELARVYRLRPDGTPAGSFGAGELKRPTGLARDARRGRVFVADTHAHDIKVYSDDGKLLATWGRAGEGPGEFNYPTHLSYAADALLVADTMNARVQVFDADGRAVRQVGKRGRYVGNLVRPKGVASDDEGNIYVIESMHDTLLVFDAEGRLLMPLGGTGPAVGSFYLPAGVWVDRQNRVFVADMFNGRISIFQFLGSH